ncbi:histidine kinase [Microbacterium hatanonis]|uniref:Histidine kinase n=1 Tax=Microbacterium hatanonis TaxID=404366 RepID=A0A5C8I6N7_9MICO|nr:histidine kinase [Microbacterium hatanonis]TXK13573.1 histidine kinase [Microbacterium hatanonis]
MPVRVLAAAVLALEAAGALALVVWQIAALVEGDTVFLTTALALIVLTVVAAGALGAFAVATARDQSWGRSGGIVVQILILAVALGALTGIGADPLTALAIAAPGAIGLVLLVAAVRRAAPERPDDV